MAIKYYPEDYDSQTIGIKFPMNGNGSNGGFFNTSRTTEEQAVTNYINLLLTKKGERYMQPNFGVYLQGYLFEQNTPALRTRLEHEIRTQAAYWLPHIINEEINVKPRAEIAGLAADPENALQIIITFRVSNSLANKTITVFQENGRISTILD